MFSVGEFDMKASRLLFASLLCGMLNLGVTGFEANAAVGGEGMHQSHHNSARRSDRAGGNPRVRTQGEQQRFPAVPCSISLNSVLSILDVAKAIVEEEPVDKSDEFTSDIRNRFIMILQEIRNRLVNNAGINSSNEESSGAIKVIDDIYILLSELCRRIGEQTSIEDENIGIINGKQFLEHYQGIFRLFCKFAYKFGQQVSIL
jgi:hypothetical protein